MAGFLPNEGENLVLNAIFKKVTTDLGTDMELGLFTNASVSETTSATDLTEPTGGGYARKTLTDASWSITADTASYAQQTFTATGSAYTGTVKGYFILTTGTTPRIIAIEVDSLAPYTINDGDSYAVTPIVKVA